MLSPTKHLESRQCSWPHTLGQAKTRIATQIDYPSMMNLQQIHAKYSRSRYKKHIEACKKNCKSSFLHMCCFFVCTFFAHICNMYFPGKQTQTCGEKQHIQNIWEHAQKMVGMCFVFCVCCAYVGSVSRLWPVQAWACSQGKGFSNLSTRASMMMAIIMIIIMMIANDYNCFIVKICQDNLDGYDGPKVYITPRFLSLGLLPRRATFPPLPPASPPQAAPGISRGIWGPENLENHDKTGKWCKCRGTYSELFHIVSSFLCLCPTCYGLQMIRSIFEQDAQDERTDKCCEALHRRLIGKTVWIGTITALIHGKKSVIKWCEQNMLGFGENSQLLWKDSIQENIVWTHSRYLIPMQNTAVFVYFVCPMAFAIRRFWKLMEIVDSGCPFCFRACGIVPSGSGITGPDDAFWGVWVAKSDTNDGVTLKAYLPCKHRATTPRLFYNSIQSGRVIDPCAMQAFDWEGLR